MKSVARNATFGLGLAAGLLCAVAAGPAFAQQSGGEGQAEQGTLTYVDLANGQVVFGDGELKLTPDTRYTRSGGVYARAEDLQRGQQVRVWLEDESVAGRPVVAHIEILSR